MHTSGRCAIIILAVCGGESLHHARSYDVSKMESRFPKRLLQIYAKGAEFAGVRTG
ncbi:hypothetical protein RUMCAL_01707 [Ruminococcus callidus ATCC 27760]|uniref:Uncharacterized protein n=1 Tax=Ruminococcus callidus ATCC 27760 TaxID=411473 RepID=U2M716_9FIRM|nr:hypothetical protein RUMCAL_01707 [Ruminococcus callidus ATCC 27760]